LLLELLVAGFQRRDLGFQRVEAVEDRIAGAGRRR
jgi:hypothetical protein